MMSDIEIERLRSTVSELRGKVEVLNLQLEAERTNNSYLAQRADQWELEFKNLAFLYARNNPGNIEERGDVKQPSSESVASGPLQGTPNGFRQ